MATKKAAKKKKRAPAPRTKKAISPKPKKRTAKAKAATKKATKKKAVTTSTTKKSATTERASIKTASARKTAKRPATTKRITKKKVAKKTKSAARRAPTKRKAKRPAARAARRSYTAANAPADAPRKPPNARTLMALSQGFHESAEDKRKRALAIDAELTRLYPDAHCELDFANAFELVIATILAAQCTDVTVNKVTKVLFAHYPDPHALAKATIEEVEPIIKPTGFFRNKAKAITGCAKQLVEKHGGGVPKTMEELTALPGVARKTANVVLGNAYKINVGFVVDTHVTRISQLLHLTASDDAKKIEQDMMALFPQDTWDMVSHRIIFHGRRCCVAKKPDCAGCGLNKLNLCPSADPAT